MINNFYKVVGLGGDNGRQIVRKGMILSPAVPFSPNISIKLKLCIHLHRLKMNLRQNSPITFT